MADLRIEPAFGVGEVMARDVKGRSACNEASATSR